MAVDVEWCTSREQLKVNTATKVNQFKVHTIFEWLAGKIQYTNTKPWDIAWSTGWVVRLGNQNQFLLWTRFECCWAGCCMFVELIIESIARGSKACLRVLWQKSFFFWLMGSSYMALRISQISQCALQFWRVENCVSTSKLLHRSETWCGLAIIKAYPMNISALNHFKLTVCLASMQRNGYR